MASARRSGYADHPGYRVDLIPAGRRVRVRYGDTVLADSTGALEVRETAHAPVLYLPAADVRHDLLEPTAHRTFCPFKGEASYWSLRLADRTEPNLVWGYEEPFDEVAGLRGHRAFYADRVVLEEG